MSAEIEAVGDGGWIRVGYREAAIVRSWRLAPSVDRPVRQYRIDAQVGRCSAFWLAQRPLTVGLVSGDTAWEWTVSAVNLAADRTFSLVVEGMPTITRPAMRPREPVGA